MISQSIEIINLTIRLSRVCLDYDSGHTCEAKVVSCQRENDAVGLGVINCISHIHISINSIFVRNLNSEIVTKLKGVRVINVD